MESIFLHIETGKISWVASSVLLSELRRNPDMQRREDALGMLKFAVEVRRSNNHVGRRARVLAALGYSALDALHLALAEDANVDLLITTDDRFLRKINRGLGNPTIRAANPLDWIQRGMP